MIVKASRMSRSIRITTIVVLAMTAGLLVAGVKDAALLGGGVFLGAITLACYLLAPAAYEIADGRLTVLFHAGKKSFGPVVSCTRVTERIPFTLRLFGNGGLFAGTGIFWNRPYGVFRVYVTSARRQDAVLVQTANGKILITPEDPQAFVKNAQTLGRQVRLS